MVSALLAGLGTGAGKVLWLAVCRRAEGPCRALCLALPAHAKALFCCQVAPDSQPWASPGPPCLQGLAPSGVAVAEEQSTWAMSYLALLQTQKTVRQAANTPNVGEDQCPANPSYTPGTNGA